MDGYDWPVTDAGDPIDAVVRERIRALIDSGAISESEFARRSGTKQPWLHRYVRGEGHASIDEVIRLSATYSGVQAMPLTESESELVRLWRALKTDDDREDLLAYARMRVRLLRSKESSAPESRTTPARVSKVRGTRKAAGG